MRRIASILAALLCVGMAAAQSAEKFRITHRPYLQNLSDTEVTIVWTTNLPGVAWVEIAPDDGTNFYATERSRFYDSRSGIKREDTVHAVRLSGLKAGTTYRYRVFSTHVLSHKGKEVRYGETASTKVYRKEPLRFRTSSPEQTELRFALFSDIHGKGEMLEKLWAHTLNPDIVLFDGDMVSILDNENNLFSGFMDCATKLFASETPMYYVRGNHETRGEFAPMFQRYFSVLQPEIYYAFRRGDTCFVMLDTGEDKPDSDIEYSSITDYDFYRTQQAKWLEQVLQSEMYTTARHRIIVGHIPPLTKGKGGEWHGNLEVRKKFMSLIDKSGADVYLAGHIHRYARWNRSEERPVPVVTNSNKTVLVGEISKDGITLSIINAEGKTVDSWRL